MVDDENEFIEYDIHQVRAVEEHNPEDEVMEAFN